MPGSNTAGRDRQGQPNRAPSALDTWTSSYALPYTPQGAMVRNCVLPCLCSRSDGRQHLTVRELQHLWYTRQRALSDLCAQVLTIASNAGYMTSHQSCRGHSGQASKGQLQVQAHSLLLCHWHSPVLAQHCTHSNSCNEEAHVHLESAPLLPESCISQFCLDCRCSASQPHGGADQ
jgi:hypothetical protein